MPAYRPPTYGTAIAHCLGILDRALAPFPDVHCGLARGRGAGAELMERNEILGLAADGRSRAPAHAVARGPTAYAPRRSATRSICGD